MSTLASRQGSSGVTTTTRLKILVVDDEESMRKLLRMRLSDTCEVVDTGDPEQAVALALEHNPMSS